MFDQSHNLAPSIPHTGKMHWLDVAFLKDGAVHARRIITADHLFVRNGILLQSAIIEMLSQTAACEAVILAHEKKLQVQIGMLVAIRDLQFSADAGVGCTLLLHARREKTFGSLVNYAVRADIENTCIVQGRMTFHLTLK